MKYYSSSINKQPKKHIRHIILKNNVIYIYQLNHPACVSEFIRCVNICLKNEETSIEVVVKCSAVFPNACLPIAGLIQYYKDVHGVDFRFDIRPQHYLISCGFERPFYLSAKEIKADKHPFDKIICYDKSEQVAELTQSYINAISRSSECASGVIDSLIWCLNEVMDNVLLHSESDCGYILVQYHPQKKHIAIW